MAFKSHLNTGKGTGAGRFSGGGSSTTYGRVVHIVLSDTDPYYDNPSMINGVYYRILGDLGEENEIRRFPFAYQGSSTNRTLPLPGEVVKIENGAGPESLENIEETVSYWKEVVNIWNHPHHGAGPDTTQQDWRDNLLKSFPEQKTINPLKGNPGDTLIEGRLGQSIRLGGAQGSTSLIDSTNTGKPIILISNGQVETKNGNELIEEDINEDFNSIYLVSDHIIPITPANNKEDTYNTLPTATNQYRGNQVIINGGRLVFNAKEDAILLKSKQSIGLSGESVNLDANSYMCFDSSKIFIGRRARTATESVRQGAVLGKQLETWLETLLNTLETISSAMTSASAVGAGPVIQLNTVGPVLKSTVGTLKSQLKTFQSKKVFIE